VDINETDLKGALEIIREFCRSYQGKHTRIFSELGDRIAKNTSSTEDIVVDTKIQYLDAISTLLNMVQRPCEKTLRKLLDEIQDITGCEELEDVQIVDSNDEVRYSLVEILNRPQRKLSRVNAELIEEFRSQLPATEWPSIPNSETGQS